MWLCCWWRKVGAGLPDVFNLNTVKVNCFKVFRLTNTGRSVNQLSFNNMVIEPVRQGFDHRQCWVQWQVVKHKRNDVFQIIDSCASWVKRFIVSQNQSMVVVMSESSFVENPKPGKKPKRVNHLKLVVFDDLKADTISSTVKELVNPSAKLTTDDAIP